MKPQFEAPAKRLRADVDQHGSARGTVAALLKRFGQRDVTQDIASEVEAALENNGLHVEPPLPGCGLTTEIAISRSAGGRRKQDQRNTWGRKRGSSRIRTGAVVGLSILASAGGGIGGYVLGNSSGEDLNAARVAGTKAGAAIGARRGKKKGYAEGFKAGRKQGYKQTYRKAYTAAHDSALGQ